jgi:hypothetical protein
VADPANVLARLRDYWAAQDVGSGVPVSEIELVAHERRYGVGLPSDLRAYFLEINGMARHEERGLDWDEDLIRFYPLFEFRPLDEEWPDTAVSGPRELFVFADCSIWVWGYVIRLSGETAGEVYIVGGDEPVRVACSFSEFLERYLARDRTGIYPQSQ